jgi:hypothetical protein
MGKLANIRKQINSGQPVQHHHVVEQGQKVCNKMKAQCQDDSDSEEEDHVWKPVSMDLKDRQVVIDSLTDEQFDWSKLSKDGKESNSNFHEWVDHIGSVLYKIHVKKNDDDIFE